MSSTYSSDLRIQLMGPGDQAGTWGSTTNNNLQYIFEQAIAGLQVVSVTTTPQALTYLNGASPTLANNQAICAERYKRIDGSLTAGDKRMAKIEYLLYAVMAAVLLGPGVAAEFVKKLFSL